MHCVDLGESFPTSIYLQNLAAIQPRTSLVKFARSPRTDPSGPAAGDSGAGVGFDVDVEQDQADFLVAKIRDHGSDLGSDEAWDSEDERQKDLFAKANWAANKRFEISKFKFKFPRARTYEMIGLVLACIEARFFK